ncbi:hypothetical protein COOONC_26192 [Cooperia oncophora]
MLSQIAYPDFILDSKKLDDYYYNRNCHDGTSNATSKRLTEVVDRNEYNFNAAVVNAHYDFFSNSIKFPAAILQAPFFHHTFPRALNYAGIGAVIGHEITHAFDDQGALLFALFVPMYHVD